MSFLGNACMDRWLCRRIVKHHGCRQDTLPLNVSFFTDSAVLNTQYRHSLSHQSWDPPSTHTHTHTHTLQSTRWWADADPPAAPSQSKSTSQQLCRYSITLYNVETQWEMKRSGDTERLRGKDREKLPLMLIDSYSLPLRAVLRPVWCQRIGFDGLHILHTADDLQCLCSKWE